MRVRMVGSVYVRMCTVMSIYCPLLLLLLLLEEGREEPRSTEWEDNEGVLFVLKGWREKERKGCMWRNKRKKEDMYSNGVYWEMQLEKKRSSRSSGSKLLAGTCELGMWMIGEKGEHFE